MEKLEESHSGKARLLESLQSELSSVQAQQHKLEQVVGGKRDSLAADERQLRVGTIFQCLTEISFVVINCSLILCRVRYRRRCL